MKRGKRESAKKLLYPELIGLKILCCFKLDLRYQPQRCVLTFENSALNQPFLYYAALLSGRRTVYLHPACLPYRSVRKGRWGAKQVCL